MVMSSDEQLGFGFDPKAIARDELRQIVTAGQELTRETAQAIADTAGVAIRTVWYWAATERAQREQQAAGEDRRDFLQRLADDGPGGFVFDSLAVAMVYAVGGNLRVFHGELSRHFTMPSYETVTRRWAQLPPLVRDGARRGVKNRFNRCLHVLHSSSSPNDTWQLDDFWLDIEVLAPGCSRRKCRPHLLLLIDDYDRMPVGYAVLPSSPTSADVLAVLAAAMEVRPADNGAPVMLGGMPRRILWDNATINTADVVTDALSKLPTLGRACAPYTPVAKGKVERAGQTIQQEVVRGIAGVLTTAASPSNRDLFASRVRDLVTFDELVSRVQTVVFDYAYTRRHSALRRTPIDFRAASGYQPGAVPDDLLASMWLPVVDRGSSRKVQPVGVPAFAQYWTAPEFDALIGSEVELRMLHHRRERLAVFNDGTFVCFAVPNMNIDPLTRGQIVDDRRDQTRRVYRAAKAARAVQAEAARRVADGYDDDLVAATTAAAGRRVPRRAPGPAAASEAEPDPAPPVEDEDELEEAAEVSAEDGSERSGDRDREDDRHQDHGLEDDEDDRADGHSDSGSSRRGQSRGSSRGSSRGRNGEGDDDTDAPVDGAARRPTAGRRRAAGPAKSSTPPAGGPAGAIGPEVSDGPSRPTRMTAKPVRRQTGRSRPQPAPTPDVLDKRRASIDRAMRSMGLTPPDGKP